MGFNYILIFIHDWEIKTMNDLQKLGFHSLHSKVKNELCINIGLRILKYLDREPLLD